MNGLIKKISSYNIFNYLFPGVLFAVIVDTMTSYRLIYEDIVLGLFVYYFMGLIISRIGSLIVEPVLKKTKFLTFAEYGEFVEASQYDPKIETLSETNNMYRTMCALFIALLFVALFDQLEMFLSWDVEDFLPIMCGILLVVFLFAYRKQTVFICKRVHRLVNENSIQSENRCKNL